LAKTVPELFSFLADFFPKFANLKVLLFSKVRTSKALPAAAAKDRLESSEDTSWHPPCSHNEDKSLDANKRGTR
jgi:hypothetical protein